MPPRSAAEKLARKQQLEEKREARRLAKEKREMDKAAQSQVEDVPKQASVMKGKCYILTLSDDSLHHVMCFLSSRDVGALTLTCRHFSQLLVEARVSFVLSRLNQPTSKMPGAVGCVYMCSNQNEARSIVQQAYGGGDTKRIVAKGKARKHFASEFVTYARFLEEAVSGYSPLRFGGKSLASLPPFVNGRFTSVSPEHSLCRIGGGETSGAGGSGVSSWGVGKRGQLGHGKREDERKPRMLLGGIGYNGIRVVQLSAGGGLARVAHSLLLTSSGRVMSFGTGQYGSLGHGFSPGKQLPDVLRPRYVEALNGIRCVCVSAGELHSAAVTADGDVYTWGDGFCGQLGHGDKTPQPAPVQVTKGDLEDECISHVSCGARHTIAVTEEGQVFSWGLGHFGVLGRSYTRFDHEPEVALVGMGDEAEDTAAAARLQERGHQPQAPENGGAAPQGSAAWDFEALMAELDRIANLKLADSSDQCIPKIIDSLESIKIVGASAGHRHTLLLDEHGQMYSCGSGITGCLGLGDNSNQMYPMKIKQFDLLNIKIMQMSAGVDLSMAVSTTGVVYAWGKTDGGRIGLGLQSARVTFPRQVCLGGLDKEQQVKAVDVECGYVHSIIIALDGTIYQCGEVGVDGEDDGLNTSGEPRQVDDFNIWHRIPEPKEHVAKAEKWKKYGKYEVKGRQKMISESYDSALK